jgi:hypothetical protein
MRYEESIHGLDLTVERRLPSVNSTELRRKCGGTSENPRS